MIGRIAERLGFDRSVSVALIDDWLVPSLTAAPIELAPRAGFASCRIDEFGRLQIDGEQWTLDLTLAGGARWVAVAEAERVSQCITSPGVVETTVQTPSGPVVQRVAAGVVGGQPVAIVEVENVAGVAIAAGLALRPLRLDGRGYVPEVAASTRGFTVGERMHVTFSREPASVVAHAGADGDVLAHLPAPDAGTTVAAARCRSGGAQAAAVWPLAHTATLRFVVALDGPVNPTASVPSIADISRGWLAHMQPGMRVHVDDLDVGDHLAQATQAVLTLWPDAHDAPLAVLATSELGFGRDVDRFFRSLERCENDELVLAAMARWAQLDSSDSAVNVEDILARVAQAAHAVDGRGGRLVGAAPWLNDALLALGGRLHQIGQPDVADRVHSLTVATSEDGASTGVDAAPVTEFLQLTKQRDKRGAWPGAVGAGQMASAARFARSVRQIVVADSGVELSLLPSLPTSWRGRAVDVFNAPIANGTVSFGLRWHGPRPALLWEADLVADAPVRISAPGLDPAFASTERQGETLLADPGWKQS